MARCALCPAELTADNYTGEHIIPHALGGRRKVPYFICRQCNSEAGEVWDAELVKQLNWFAVALNISRQKGVPASQAVTTVSGEKLLMHPDGTLSPMAVNFSEATTEDGRAKISFNARTIPEARQILKGVAKKYPKSDLEVMAADLRTTSRPLDEPIHMTISVGGHLTGRSITKTAVAMASHMGIAMADCAMALRYLVDPASEVVWSAFHLRDLLVHRSAGHLCHVVAVAGDADSGRLLGYVEFFGAFRFVVILSQDYQGPVVQKSYTLDPVSGEELAVDVALSLSTAELDLVLKGDAGPIDGRIADLNLVMPYILDARNKQGREVLMKELIAETFAEFGVQAGESLSSDSFPEFSKRVAEKAVDRLMRPHLASPYKDDA